MVVLALSNAYKMAQVGNKAASFEVDNLNVMLHFISVFEYSALSFVSKYSKSCLPAWIVLDSQS